MGSPVYSMVASLPAFHFRFDLTQWNSRLRVGSERRAGEGEGNNSGAPAPSTVSEAFFWLLRKPNSFAKDGLGLPYPNPL